ncbi:hypothetical protein EJB05_12716 [Eragrostis curvula]|uniref:Uncharacterized protein n=1 Tax=Eragrostis curvula TaxID=38414 RepID=A0A5J9VU75_9POAL|nr:hypothetical protein EJB05_12716 [Eragrostis curvula]
MSTQKTKRQKAIGMKLSSSMHGTDGHSVAHQNMSQGQQCVGYIVKSSFEDGSERFPEVHLFSISKAALGRHKGHR